MVTVLADMHTDVVSSGAHSDLDRDFVLYRLDDVNTYTPSIYMSHRLLLSVSNLTTEE